MNKILEFVSVKVGAFIFFIVVTLSVKGFNSFYSQEAGILFLACLFGTAFLGYDYEVIKNEVIKNWHAESLENFQPLKDKTFFKYAICALIFSLVYNLIGAAFFASESWYENNTIFFGGAFAVGGLVWILLKIIILPYVAYRIAKKSGQRKKLLLLVIIAITAVVIIVYLKSLVMSMIN